jgi:ketosteroid isomerase-like protein
MKLNPSSFLSFLLLMFLASCGTKGESARDTPADTDAIRQQIAKYTAALEAGDPALASQVWLNSPDISFISPAGHQRGWAEVKEVYEFFGKFFTERKLTARDVTVRVYGDSAWVEFYWKFTGKQISDGSAMQSEGRETQVYRKIDGKRWSLVHVHYSGMPTTP